MPKKYGSIGAEKETARRFSLKCKLLELSQTDFLEILMDSYGVESKEELEVIFKEHSEKKRGR